MIGSVAIAAVLWVAIWTGSDERRTPIGPRDAAADPSPVPSPVLQGDLAIPLAERIARAARARSTPRAFTLPVRSAIGEEVAGISAAIEIGFGPVPEGSARFEAGRGVILALPGEWPRIPRIRIEAPGFAPAIVADLVLPDADAELDGIRLDSGRRIRGRVLAPGGAAAPAIRIEAYAPEDDPLERVACGGGAARTAPAATAVANRRGEFDLGPIGARFVRLEIDGGDAWARGLIEEVEAGAASVRHELEPRASIEGVVVDESGKPRAGAGVAVRMTGTSPSSCGTAFTGADGRFELDSLAPGYYALVATGPRCERATLAHVHTDVRGLRIELRTRPAARLRIAGAPADLAVPARVRSWSGSSRPRPAGPPVLAWLRDGVLEVEGLTAGRHSLEIEVPGARPLRTAAVDFVSGEVSDLGSFELEAGATLTLRALGPDGAAVRARAALASPHHTAIALGRDVFSLPDRSEHATDADGALRLDGLGPGERVLALRADGCADRNLRITIPDRGELDLGSIALAAGGSIEGVVRAGDGRAIPEVEIRLIRSGCIDRVAVTDLGGRFAVDRLEPGRWEVTALRSDSAPARDLADALAPADNPRRLVVVSAGETARCEIALDAE